MHLCKWFRIAEVRGSQQHMHILAQGCPAPGVDRWRIRKKTDGTDTCRRRDMQWTGACCHKSVASTDQGHQLRQVDPATNIGDVGELYG